MIGIRGCAAGQRQVRESATELDSSRRRRCVRHGAGLVLVLGSLAGAALSEDVAPPTAHLLLERMTDAVRMLDYEGRFVVQAGDRLDAMHIVHWADQGRERERVLSLTGKAREIVRNGEAVACLAAGDRRPISYARRAQSRTVSPLRGVSIERLEQFYRLALAGEARVAGRDTHQVLIEPRDELRYGYRVYIDKASALPLRSVMFNAQGQIVAQMMFVDLRLGDAVLDADDHPDGGLPALPLATYSPEQELSEYLRLTPTAWEFAEVPPGFQMHLYRRSAVAEGEGELEHFVFSDGLASVSVYIQPMRADAELDGESARGPAKSIGRLLDDQQVFVVGEAPMITLRRFAENIRAASR